MDKLDQYVVSFIFKIYCHSFQNRVTETERNRQLGGRNSIPEDQTLKITYTNAQNLQNKIIELKGVAYEIRPDLIILTETWCNPSITNTLLNIPGYFIDPALRIDRSDTNSGRGGGILIHVRNRLTILSHNQPNSTLNQYCSFTIKSADSEINLLCIYRSPNS